MIHITNIGVDCVENLLVPIEDPSIAQGLIGDVDQMPENDNDYDKIFSSPCLSYESCESIEENRDEMICTTISIQPSSVDLEEKHKNGSFCPPIMTEHFHASGL